MNYILIIGLYFEETKQNPLLLFLNLFPKILLFENVSGYDRNARMNRLSDMEKDTMKRECAERRSKI